MNKEKCSELDISLLLKKYYPTFLLSKFVSEEGREKVVKKFKELLDKYKFMYDENVLNTLIPKGK